MKGPMYLAGHKKVVNTGMHEKQVDEIIFGI